VLRPSEPDSLSDIIPFRTGFRHIDTTKDAQNTVMVGISHLRFVFRFEHFQLNGLVSGSSSSIPMKRRDADVSSDSSDGYVLFIIHYSLSYDLYWTVREHLGSSYQVKCQRHLPPAPGSPAFEQLLSVSLLFVIYLCFSFSCAQYLFSPLLCDFASAPAFGSGSPRYMLLYMNSLVAFSSDFENPGLGSKSCAVMLVSNPCDRRNVVKSSKAKALEDAAKTDVRAVVAL